MGVFATRSPFRPNPLGLSCVEIESVQYDHQEGPVIHVKGADLMDGTPIYDIKPYLAFTDSHPDAVGGFADDVRDYALEVDFPEHLLALIPEDERDTVTTILRGDPRPQYKADGDRIYGMIYGNNEIHFKVENGVLTVTDVNKR